MKLSEVVFTLCIPSLALNGFNFLVDKERGKDNSIEIRRYVKKYKILLLGFLSF